jgi:hypothetical protein
VLSALQMQLGGWDKSSQLAGQKRLASGMLVGQQGLGRQPSMGLVPTTSMGAIGGLADNKRVKVEGDKNILAKVGGAGKSGGELKLKLKQGTAADCMSPGWPSHGTVQLRA